MNDGVTITAGILPIQEIEAALNDGHIAADTPVGADQVQPASLDLRLGNVAWRIRASFLPGRGASVRDKVADIVMHEIDLTRGAVLETGCVYLVPLMERLALPSWLSGMANPKSSTGRIDVFTRLITDGAHEFDAVPAGYKGPLYAEISPRTFSVLVRAGSRLNQLRLRRGSPRVSDAELRHLQARETLIEGEGDIDQGIAMSVDLEGDGGVVGYRARRHAGVIDVDRAGAHERDDFWEPIRPLRGGRIVLDPNEFYILASKEAVHVPPDFAAEMVPFNPAVGEFRVHYAGFFDPGFGHGASGGAGSRAVLEVRSHEVPFILEDGQQVGRLIYERLAARPRTLYGTGIGSHYQAQGLKLSKHFR
jgi:dCTP deaminase